MSPILKSQFQGVNVSNWWTCFIFVHPIKSTSDSSAVSIHSEPEWFVVVRWPTHIIWIYVQKRCWKWTLHADTSSPYLLKIAVFGSGSELKLTHFRVWRIKLLLKKSHERPTSSQKCTMDTVWQLYNTIQYGLGHNAPLPLKNSLSVWRLLSIDVQ